MKNKWYFISSIIQLAIGVISVAAFIVLAVNGEDIGKWIVTLILAAVFIVLGAVGVAEYKRK